MSSTTINGSTLKNENSSQNCTHNSLINSDSSFNKLANTNSFSYLLNTTPVNATTTKLQDTQSYFNQPLTAAYLPATNADLYFTTTNSADGLVTSIPAGYMASSLTDLTFRSTVPLATKSLLYNTKSSAAFATNASLNACINGKKRKRRYKKPPELRKVLPKNSLMLLHELRPNVEYRFICQSGPIHRPIFTMCVDINEHKFEGCGKTKKEARMAAAEKAYQFLLDHPEHIQKSNHPKKNNGDINNYNSSTNNNIDENNDNNETNHGNDDDEDEDEDDENEENFKNNFDNQNENELENKKCKRLKLTNDDSKSDKQEEKETIVDNIQNKTDESTDQNVLSINIKTEESISHNILNTV